jgi:tRNA-modifying protein YgfZ
MTLSTMAALLPGRGVVGVAGPDRATFLQGLVTNDVRELAPDRALYAGLLSPQGKLLCDFVLTEDGMRILIETAAPQATDLVRRLTLYKLRAQVEIADLTPAFKVAALWGAGAADALGLPPFEGAASPAAWGGCAFVDPRLAALGVRLLHKADGPALEDQLAASGVAVMTEANYTAHRLAQGIPDSTEIGGEICYPLEANFETLHGVDFKKGCYVGQELTARMKHKGGLRKRVLPVAGTADLPAAGTPVAAGGTELGSLIAASGPQGLALLRLDRLAEAQAGAIMAGSVTLSVHWPSWLPR